MGKRAVVREEDQPGRVSVQPPAREKAPAPLLGRLKELWGYLHRSFEEGDEGLRRIQRAPTPDALFAAMLSDKKKLGAKIHFVLLEGWGRAKAVPLDPAAVRGALAAVL